jgi:vanillin dehydrogenase
VPDSGKAETAAAIEAAHAAFPEWAALPFSKRAHYLHKAAEIWERRKMEIVEAIQAEGGGWFGKGMFETGYVTEVFHAAAASVWQSTGEVLPSEYGKVSMAVRRPMGVVSVISPWNFPCILTARGFLFPLPPATPSCSSRRRRRPISAGFCLPRSSRRRACPRASSTW